MWLLFIIFSHFSVTSCNAVIEFGSRPTNVSLLLTHFTHQAVKGPVVLGPFGLWSLMAGLSFGAQGDTKREIFRSFLLLTNRTKFNEQYKNLTDVLFQENGRGVEVSCNNYFFVDKNVFIYPDFKEILTEDFNSTFMVIDFNDPIAAADRANSFVKNSGQSVKHKFFSEDFKDTSIIMSNDLLFQGVWSIPFNKSHTVYRTVTSSNGEVGYVNMMLLKAKLRSSHMPSMKATITELPYGTDRKYCMLLLFPDPNVSIKEMYKGFEAVTFRDIFAKLESDIDEFGLKDVDVMLPNFAKRSNLQLQKPINDMGVYDAFEPSYAKFGHMVREPLYMGTIEHDTILLVSEQGTLARTITPSYKLKLDNIKENKVMPPFSFFIIEKSTATVIFDGIF